MDSIELMELVIQWQNKGIAAREAQSRSTNEYSHCEQMGIADTYARCARELLALIPESIL